MKKTTLVIVLILNSLFAKPQVLGGYTIYDHLSTAIHPGGCSAGYVANLPDDSIWVNFNNGDSITGNFSMPSKDQAGYDLLLETGFNTSNYLVSLLLSTGQYSDTHSVVLTDWFTIANITWQYAFTSCGTGTQADAHYIVPLDYGLDFGLTPSDTVIGIKVIFLNSAGAPDIAGAYIISSQQVGIHEQGSDAAFNLYPNPFSGILNITAGDNDCSEFNLYDFTSRKILQEKFINSVTINTERLENGIYIYEVKNKYGLIRKGIVVKE
jgi:hypothetical protein